MRPMFALSLVMSVFGATAALAAGSDGHANPYAGLHERPVKALSETQFRDLQAGKGMSLALAAELNGYPGPQHVLDLTDDLALSAEQRAATRALLDAMRREAIALGMDVIGAERRLDRLFADRHASGEEIAAAVAEAARQHGLLRLAHLKYHVDQRRLLDLAQLERYGKLRGYGARGGANREVP